MERWVSSKIFYFKRVYTIQDFMKNALGGPKVKTAGGTSSDEGWRINKKQWAKYKKTSTRNKRNKERDNYNINKGKKYYTTKLVYLDKTKSTTPKTSVKMDISTIFAQINTDYSSYNPLKCQISNRNFFNLDLKRLSVLKHLMSELGEFQSEIAENWIICLP